MCLTLPGPAWVFEQGLCNKFQDHGFNIRGVERNLACYTQAVNSIKRVQRKLTNAFINMEGSCCTMQSVLSSTQETYDLIYLDYCAAFVEKIEADLNLAFERRLLNKGGYLGLTLECNQSCPNPRKPPRFRGLPIFITSHKTSKELERHKYRIHWVLQRVKKIASKHRIKLAVTKTSLYKEDGRARLMINLWFRIY